MPGMPQKLRQQEHSRLLERRMQKSSLQAALLADSFLSLYLYSISSLSLVPWGYTSALSLPV